MERTPHQGGDLQGTQAPPLPPPEQTPSQLQESLQLAEDQESHDEQVIRQGIEQARLSGTDIDNRTARYIAAQLHEDQSSALYSLASSGAITETLTEELTRDFDQQTNQVQTWITWLSSYCRSRADKGPVSDWAASAAAIDRAEAEAQAHAEEEEHTRTNLMERISAASVTTLGHIATITTGSNPLEHNAADIQHEPPSEYDEPDDFPWYDAARWSPDGPSAESIQDRLDLLFSHTSTATIGSVEHMGWFGLLTVEGQAGGIILSQNSYGSRHAWATASDQELTQQWEQLQREHDAFSAATRPHQTQSREKNRRNNSDGGDGDDQQQPQETTRIGSTEQKDTTSGHYPEIWVGSLSDYTNGQLHGAWLDATLDPEDLHNAIQFILRHSYYPGVEEWAIMDYGDFCGLNLGEYEPLAVVSRIAQGIAEHGEAFAAWVGYVGERSEELLSEERFRDHYLGHFESTEAYAEYILEETGSYEYLDQIPESLPMYAKFDTEQMGRDMEIELYVVESEDGGVFVFDTRC